MALYHQTNNGPVEVKKHQIKGAVGYTVIGTPTIKDGIVSGFSSSDYIEVPFNKNWKVISEFVVSIKDKQASGNMRFLACTNNTTLSFGCNETSVWVSIGSQIIGAIDNNLMPDGHDYIIRYTRVGSVCSLYITQDNGSEQFVGSITEDGENDNSSEIRFLYNDNLGDTKVDFNHTYIKVNGDLWFYQPQETKYIIRENPTTHAQHLVFANRDLFLSGAVVLEEEGSPLVKDGIFTYTSGSDYLQAEETLTWDESSDLEVYSRFKTPSTFHESNMPVISNEPWSTPFVWVWGDSVYFQLPSTNIAVYPPNSGSLSTDTWYRIKVTGKNNSWTMTLYADDGTVINQITYTPSTGTALTMPIAISRQYSGYPPVACVDLKETYIKKNGKLWLYGKNFSDTNIAVVPEGFTYGTKTTTSNGYVDMRTQGFLAAPEGARFCGEEPETPPVIDANTLACWHLDTGYPSPDVVHQYAFANANYNGSYQSTGGWDNGYFSGKSAIFNWWNYASMALTSMPLTVDFRYKPSSYPSDFNFGFGQNGGASNYVYGMKILASGTKIATTAGMTAAEFDLTSKSIDINDGNWHHVAFEFNYSAGKVNYYVDGKYIGNGTVNSPSGTIYFMDFSSDSTNGIDELRVSDINRYNGEDFTVPAGPYESAS